MFYILLVALWLFSLLLSFVILFCFHCFSVSTLCLFFFLLHSFYCLFALFLFSFFVSLVLINYSQNYFVIVLSVFFLFYVCVFVVTFFICCCFWYVLGSVFFFYFKFFCYFFPFLPFLSVCTLLALGSCIVGCRLCWRVEPGPPGWEHRVQDVGAPENFWVQGILIGMHVHGGTHIKRPSPVQLPAGFSARNVMPVKRITQIYPSVNGLPEIILSSQISQDTPPDEALTYRV